MQKLSCRIEHWYSCEIRNLQWFFFSSFLQTFELYIISVRYTINSWTSKWWLKKNHVEDLHFKKYFLNFKAFTNIVLLTGSPENSGGSSFWNYGRTAMDYTHVLKKYVYQLASRSPHSLTTTNNDNDQSNSYNGEDVSFSQIIVLFRLSHAYAVALKRVMK